MALSTEVRTPSDQTEGSRAQVIRWLKALGEHVEQNEPLLEVETDKVTVEIPAPISGVLREILKEPNQEIAPGEVLGRIESEEAQGGPAVTTESAGTGGSARVAHADADPHAGARADTRAAGPQATRVSPAVRRLLDEHGLELAAIEGSGEGGRVTVNDVLEHLAQGASSRRVPHSATRRRIAEHMVRSLLHTAPHVTTVFEADFSAVLAHRERHREQYAGRGAPLTLTAYILAACVEGLRAVPEANARWTDEALELFDQIDIGIATAVEDKGLIVPVVRNVAALSLFEIAVELQRLVALAREDRLTPAEVRGGTFTISNHGVSGSLIAAPIVINQPQVAILGVGKLQKRAVVVEESGADRIAARPRCFITLTIDHRVMDGHRANRFLEVLVQRLESWPLE